MAATIIGLSSVSFGGASETLAVFTSFSQTSDSDKTIVVDEDGDHVAVAYHGKKSVASMTGFIKSSNTPSIGATITLANSVSSLGGICGAFYVDSIAINKAPNDFSSVTVTASNHGI